MRLENGCAGSTSASGITMRRSGMMLSSSGRGRISIGSWATYLLIRRRQRRLNQTRLVAITAKLEGSVRDFQTGNPDADKILHSLDRSSDDQEMPDRELLQIWLASSLASRNFPS